MVVSKEGQGMTIKTKRTELLQAMARNGFTGKGLAKASGISQCYVVQILAGRRNVLPTTAKKICNALGCNFDELFTAEVQE